MLEISDKFGSHGAPLDGSDVKKGPIDEDEVKEDGSTRTMIKSKKSSSTDSS